VPESSEGVRESPTGGDLIRNPRRMHESKEGCKNPWWSARIHEGVQVYMEGCMNPLRGA